MKTRFILLLLISLISVSVTDCDESDPAGPETGEGDPSARIISPADSSSYILNREITFAGAAIDEEDNYLPDTSLLWESDRDGVIGTGSFFITDTLSLNSHTITLWAEDAEGRTGSDEITIDVISAYTYTEDFESDPGWVSLSADSPSNAYWDSLAGNYLVRTFDNLEDKYWAYSPEFGPVPGSTMVAMEFDMVCERGNWGTYPGIYLYNSEPTDIDNGTKTFRLSFDHSDRVYRRIQIRDRDQANVYSLPTEFQDGLWYHFEILYNGYAKEADIKITRAESGTLVYRRVYVPFVLEQFSYIAMGYYDQPNYGDSWSPIRIDNIVIQDWDVRQAETPEH